MYSTPAWSHLLFVGKQNGSLLVWNTDKLHVVEESYNEAPVTNMAAHLTTGRLAVQIGTNKSTIRVFSLFNYST